MLFLSHWCMFVWCVFIVPHNLVWLGGFTGFIGKYQICGDVIGHAFCVSSISYFGKLIIWVLSTTLQLNAMSKKRTKIDTTSPGIVNTFSCSTYTAPLPHLQVAWWNLLPFRKHLLGDSLHSQVHFVLLRGWCLGHVLLHRHWQVSLLKTWFSGQDGAGSVLQTHWQVLRSRCRLGPQSWVGSLRWHTHWQVSRSSSLSGPHTSVEKMSVETKGNSWNEWRY